MKLQVGLAFADSKVKMKNLITFGILSLCLTACNGFNTQDFSFENADGGSSPSLPAGPIKKDPKGPLAEDEELSAPPAKVGDEPSEEPTATSTTTSTTTTSTTTTLPKQVQPSPTPSTTSSTSTTSTTTTTQPSPSTTSTTQPAVVKPKPPTSDLVKAGVISPTIYFFPRVYEHPSCKDTFSKIEDQLLIQLKDRSGETLFNICNGGFKACLLQGSCEVATNDGDLAIVNVVNPNGLNPSFTVLPKGHPCRHGLGVNSSCLDAFYTVAADLTVHKPGDVIFIPAVAKAKIQLGPNHVHNGYFIVRDRGGVIKGENRFDFFSGRLHWNNSKNPFTRLGLGDKRTSYEYFKVTGEAKKRIQKSRCWPKLPTQNRTCPK